MEEVIRQDYIRTARAKGVPPLRVIWHHAFRNTLIPLVTLDRSHAAQPAQRRGDSRTDFRLAWHGHGCFSKPSASAITTRIMGLTLMFSVLTLLGQLLADILYAVVDPASRTQYRATARHWLATAPLNEHLPSSDSHRLRPARVDRAPSAGYWTRNLATLSPSQAVDDRACRLSSFCVSWPFSRRSSPAPSRSSASTKGTSTFPFLGYYVRSWENSDFPQGPISRCLHRPA